MTQSLSSDNNQRCPRCGNLNQCAMAQGAEQCWCMAEPIAHPVPTRNTASCYCRDCLRTLSASETPPQLHKPGIPR